MRPEIPVETDKAIRNGLALLVASLGREIDSMQVRAYLRGLRDVAPDVIELAADRLATEAGRKFFPTVPEWLDVCAIVVDERRKVAMRQAKARAEDCAQCNGLQWKSVIDTRGVERVARCQCWEDGRRLIAAAGDPIRRLALPAAEGEE